MPDEDRFVAQIAATFRRLLDDEGRGSGLRPETQVRNARQEEAVLAATGAALGDPRSLPAVDDPAERA